MAVVWVDENGKEYKRGDKRDDGYIFTGLRKHPSGNVRPKFLSPIAFDKRMRGQKAYYQRPEQVRKSNQRHMFKYHNDPIYRLMHNQRKRVSIAFKRLADGHKSIHTMRLIGCKQSDLKKHIESQFVDGMNWDNYGSEWHVDHIIPISWFDLTNESCQRVAFHFTNMKPLWKEENMKKGARYSG